MTKLVINMTTSAGGRAFIKGHEQLRLRAYRSGQDDKWTIGWGHTKHTKAGEVITEAEAEARFNVDVMDAEIAIKTVVHPTMRLSQKCFDALVSWEFNCGAIRSRGNTIRRFLDENRLDEIDEQILRWKFYTDPVTKEKRVSNGLARRRADEARMWNEGLADLAEADYIAPSVPVENPPSVDESANTRIAVGAGTAGTTAAAVVAAEEETGAISSTIHMLGPMAAHSKSIALVLIGLMLVGVFLMWRRSRRK